MKKTILSCDRCGRDIKLDLPDKGCLYCYRGNAENKTDKQVDLCPECYGHFLIGFLTVSAERLGIKPESQPVRNVGEPSLTIRKSVDGKVQHQRHAAEEFQGIDHLDV